MIKVGIIGAEGRMGKEIRNILKTEPDIKVTALIEKKGHESIGRFIEGIKITSELNELKNVDVVVEFTEPSASIEHAFFVKKIKKKYVLGTTGFKEKELNILKDLGKDIALVYSPNMSMGVNLLFKITELASKTLSPDFDVEIIEIHHKKKKDAPSGTAMRIADIIKKERRIKEMVYGREGFRGERKKDEMGILAVRGGDVPGEHMVIFLGDGERIELIHRAGGRRIFAKGTVEAIRFIMRKKKGFYTMQDVMGIK